MSKLKLRWFKAKDKEPPEDGVILLENDGYPAFVDYLPPRRGEKYGEWQYEDGTLEDVKPRDTWMDCDGLFYSDALDGKFYFQQKMSKTTGGTASDE